MVVSTLTNFLSSVKSSATAWLALAAATIIAGLVAALKLQGGRLHKAQVDLLAQKFAVKTDQLVKATQSSQAAYQKALDAYKAAGGTV